MSGMQPLQPFRDKSLFILVTLLVISPKSFRTDDAVSYNIYIYQITGVALQSGGGFAANLDHLGCVRICCMRGTM